MKTFFLRAKMFLTALRTEYSAPINETKAAIRVILNGFLTAKKSLKITRTRENPFAFRRLRRLRRPGFTLASLFADFPIRPRFAD